MSKKIVPKPKFNTGDQVQQAPHGTWTILDARFQDMKMIQEWRYAVLVATGNVGYFWESELEKLEPAPDQGPQQAALP